MDRPKAYSPWFVWGFFAQARWPQGFKMEFDGTSFRGGAFARCNTTHGGFRWQWKER